MKLPDSSSYFCCSFLSEAIMNGNEMHKNLPKNNYKQFSNAAAALHSLISPCFRCDRWKAFTY